MQVPPSTATTATAASATTHPVAVQERQRDDVDEAQHRQQHRHGSLCFSPLRAENVIPPPFFHSTTSSNTQARMAVEEVVLARECEYRVEIGAQSEFKIKLKSGSAELFGVELAIDHEYTLRDKKVAIFTWYGCTLEVQGERDVAYSSEETPMNSYLNIHSQLQRRRELATVKRSLGPRVLIAGPVDSGKSTLTQILTNYALRLGEKPTLVELDVGLGSLSVPGTIAASPLDMNSISVEEEFVLTNPLAYFFGHAAQSDNPELFRHQIRQLASVVQRRMANDAEVSASGCIINTSGWVDGLGYDLLVESIQAFEADVVLVIGQDRLFSRLQSSFASSGTNQSLSIVKLARSGGVVPLNSKHRSAKRLSRIREYFYGPNSLSLAVPTHSPCITEVSFDDVDFFAIKGVIYMLLVNMKVSDVMLPVGQTEDKLDRLRIVKVEKTQELLLSIAAVAHPKRSQDRDSSAANLSWLLNSPAAGFVFIKEVREDEKKLVLLVPSPGPLPSRNLILGSIKWLE
ncbi:Pre-mrna cleavage complex ii protein clp1, partial [Globisporangium splendens]